MYVTSHCKEQKPVESLDFGSNFEIIYAVEFHIQKPVLDKTRTFIPSFKEYTENFPKYGICILSGKYGLSLPLGSLLIPT
jgi:hypothetical protein